MAFKKTLVQRLFNLSRFSTPATSRAQPVKPANPARPCSSPNPDPAQIRRPLHQSASSSSSSPAPASMRLFPLTASAVRELNLDGLVACPTRSQPGFLPYPPQRTGNPDSAGLTAGEVRKVMRATQVEMIRGRLRDVGRDWVNYNEFVGLIEEFCGGNKEQAVDFVKTLDDSGSVIVLGNSVCLRPNQEIITLVAKVIRNLVTPPVSVDVNDPRRKELELMEEQKAEIDLKAEALVRRELWAGLGYMVVQTAAFMRLTFWELSWDVMEPICFYVTSAYFMIGYTFFLRTSKEPSFEGFYQSRFNAKQKRIMKAQEFDLEKYNELRKVFYPNESSPSPLEDARLIKYDYHHKVN